MSARCASASCISASGRSTAPTRPSTWTTGSRPGSRRGGSAASSLRSPDTAEALAPQDGLYTVAVRSGAGERLRVIGSVRRLLVAPDDPARAPRRHDRSGDAHRQPDRDREGLLPRSRPPATWRGPPRHRRRSRRPRVAPQRARRPRRGAGAAAARRAASPSRCCAATTCRHNGRTVGARARAFAALRDPALGRWVEDAGRVPLDHGRPHRSGDQPTPTAPRRGATRRRGRLAGDDRALHAVGDRGPLRRRPPGLGAVGAELVADVAPLRADEAAASQRQPFDARLSRLSRRLRDRRRRDGRPGLRAARAAA